MTMNPYQRSHPVAAAILAAAVLGGCSLQPGPSAGARLYPGFDNYTRAATPVAAAARPFLDQGMQWLYGFNDDEAIRCFQRAAELDPECALAWWGIGYASGININDPVM